MGEIVSLDAHRPDPHLAGAAVCLKCKHEWMSVAPVGTYLLVCPECGCDGALKGAVLKEGEVW